jgi:DNA-binding transcriptional LysR family regulator
MRRTCGGPNDSPTRATESFAETRRQSLTDIGVTYYAQCIDILARIETAENDARDMRSRPAGRLRLSAPITWDRFC